MTRGNARELAVHLIYGRVFTGEEPEQVVSIRLDKEYYEKITAVLKAKHKAAFLAEGKDEKAADRAAEKKAIEDARFVLPNACDTRIIMTMNTRSLYNFFELRCCNRAQWEIRALAIEMLKLVSVLISISENDPDLDVREAAVKRLAMSIFS